MKLWQLTTTFGGVVLVNPLAVTALYSTIKGNTTKIHLPGLTYEVDGTVQQVHKEWERAIHATRK